MNIIKNILNALLITVLSLSVLTTQADVTVVYYHNDALGSPIAATDENGDVIWRQDYGPYGEKLTDEMEALTEKIGYTGHRYDTNTGLVYAGARMYDPNLGRFMGVDPVGTLEGVTGLNNPAMFNRYAYANNNPYKYVDPDGRSPRDADDDSDGIGSLGSDRDDTLTIGQARLGSGGTDGGEFRPFIMGLGAGGARLQQPAAKGTVDPSTIRFSQDSIKGTFRDGRSVQDLAAGLKNGTIKASDVPAIRTVQRNGQTVSIDNRRLAAFREAGVPIRTRPATAKEAAQAQRQGKFSAGESGTDNIRIRGQ